MKTNSPVQGDRIHPGLKTNVLVQGDCINHMIGLPAGCVDLCFADPPFNIGFEYDEYEDNRPPEEYLTWSRQWMSQVHNKLADHGSFWLAIGDAYASELDVMAKSIGFRKRSQICWYY